MIRYYPKSRASGKCGQCRETIHRGQPAWWGTNCGWRCTGCRPAPTSPETPAASEPPATAKPPRPGKRRRPAPATTPGVRVDQSGSSVQVEFASMTDAARVACSKGEGNLANVACLDKSLDRNDGTRFFNHRTIDGIHELIRNGSKSLADLVEQLRARIADEVPLPTENRRRIRRGRETGDEIDADRFLNRIPEMWSRIEADERPARRVVVTINGAVSYSETQDNLGYRAAAAIALADALTERGASVEVRLVIRATNPTSTVGDYTASIIVKPSDQPLSIRDLATTCCDISVIRLGMVYGTTRLLPGTVSDGLGSPARLPTTGNHGDFIADRDVNSRDRAIAWVHESLTRFAGQQEVAHG